MLKTRFLQQGIDSTQIAGHAKEDQGIAGLPWFKNTMQPRNKEAQSMSHKASGISL
jgi:hypothetical protein